MGKVTKNTLNVLIANIVQLLTGIIVTFIVPRIVSVNNYSAIKTYTLYTDYIGIFSLGFYDGIYLKYGGKSRTEISPAVVRMEYSTFLVSQLLMSLMVGTISIFLKNEIIAFCALSIVPTNIFTFYKRFHVAIGEFKQYTREMLVYSFTYMLGNCVLALFLRINLASPYCLCAIVANLFAVIYNFYVNKMPINIMYKVKVGLFKENIGLGWLVLFGNIAVNAIYGIDRWFVKAFYNVKCFAVYSFAVSMLNIVMVLVQSVALSLYNYIADDKNTNKIILAKKVLLGIGGLSSGGYFLLYYIINWGLPQYVDSLSIISISFISYPYMIVINSVFLNLYKAEQKNKKYIRSVIFMLILSILLNCAAVYLSSDIRFIAVATTLSFIIWFVFCNYDFGMQYFEVSDLTFLFAVGISFIGCNFIPSKIVGMLIYSIAWCIFAQMFGILNTIVRLLVNKK